MKINAVQLLLPPAAPTVITMNTLNIHYPSLSRAESELLRRYREDHPDWHYPVHKTPVKARYVDIHDLKLLDDAFGFRPGCFTEANVTKFVDEPPGSGMSMQAMTIMRATAGYLAARERERTNVTIISVQPTRWVDGHVRLE